MNVANKQTVEVEQPRAYLFGMISPRLTQEHIENCLQWGLEYRTLTKPNDEKNGGHFFASLGRFIKKFF